MSALVAGAAEVEVVPSFTGFVTSVDKESTKAATTASRSFNRGMDRGMNRPGIWKRTGSRMASSIGGAFKTGLKLTAAGAIGLLGYSLTKGFQRLSAIDDATHKLSGLGNSAKQTDAIMKNALASVKGTAFGMDEAATTAAGAVAAGVKPGNALTRTLSLTADAATIAGTSMGDMGSIFNKVATSNKIQGDTIAQLSDKGIPIVQLLGKSLGKSSAEVVDLAKKGKINFAQFQTAMEQGLGGAAKTSGDTFSGALANVKASLGRIGAGLMGGIFPQLAPGMKQLTAAMAPLEDKSKGVGTAIGKVLAKALVKVPPLIATVKDKWENLTLAWKTGINVDNGPLGMVEKAIAWMAVHLPPVVGKVKTFFAGLKGGDGGKQFAGLLQKFKEADLSGLGDALKKSGRELGQFTKLGPVVNSGLSLAATAFGLLADHAGLVAKILPVLVAAWLAHKVAVAANETVGRNSVVGFWAQTAATLAHSIALRANASAIRMQTRANQQSVVATGEQTAAQNSGIIATVRQRIASVASAIAQRTMAAAARVAAAGQWLLNAAMNANPIGLLIIAGLALAGLFVLLWTRSATFRRIMTAAFNGVKAAALAVVGWFTRSFVPFFTKTIPAAFQSVLGFVRSHWVLILGLITGPIGLAVGLVIKHWAKIRGAFSAAAAWAGKAFRASWSVIKTILLSPVTGARALINAQIALVRGIFNRLVSWGKSTLRTQWAGLKAVLTAPIEAGKRVISTLLGVTGLRKTFSGAVSALGRIWSGLKSKITSPISSIVNWIGSHFVSPINSMLSKVGVGFRVPWPKLASGGVFHGGGHAAPARAYKSGGVLPGYSPGTDNLHFVGPAGGLSLSGGEAVMRPEWTRAVGSGFVSVMNRAARSGGVAGVRKLLGGGQAFGLGGVIGDTWNKVKGGVGKVWGGAKFLAEVALHPVEAIKKLANKLLSGISGNMWGQTAKAGIGHVVGGLANKVKDFFSPSGGGGGGTPGSLGGKGGRGWQWQWNLIHSMFPGVSLTSAYRPGAHTAGSGALSYHALGRAIDLGGSVPQLTKVAKWILGNYGASSHDLLYSPLWGNMGLYEGKWYPQPAVTVRQHGNHVHWGYDRGGVVPYRPPVFDQGGTLAPGLNVVNNKTGGPERLVRADHASADMASAVASAVAAEFDQRVAKLGPQEVFAMSKAGGRTLRSPF